MPSSWRPRSEVARLSVVKLRSIHIENFRCLRSVDLEFEDLTVLVGPNGAGKSNLLGALRTHQGLEVSDQWRGNPDALPRRRGLLGDGIPFDQNFGQAPAPWTFQELHLSASTLRTQQVLQHETMLSHDGSNLTNVLASLPRRNREQIAVRLAELVPVYRDVDLRPTHQGRHKIVLQDRWKPELWYDAAAVSDGTMLLLAFLTLGFVERPPQILGIEDPDQALHPFLLGELVSYLRKLAQGQLGSHPIQVILTTHSAQLLDFVEPQEVRFLSRDMNEGFTIIERAPVDTEHWRAAYETYEKSLGGIWLSGGLGGVPGVPTQH